MVRWLAAAGRPSAHTHKSVPAASIQPIKQVEIHVASFWTYAPRSIMVSREDGHRHCCCRLRSRELVELVRALSTPETAWVKYYNCHEFMMTSLDWACDTPCVALLSRLKKAFPIDHCSLSSCAFFSQTKRCDSNRSGHTHTTTKKKERVRYNELRSVCSRPHG